MQRKQSVIPVICCCVFVKLKLYKVAHDKSNSIGQFSQATKPRSQKLTNFINFMSSAYSRRSRILD